ncbi:MAG: carboxy-S-adenosyl-L-methionine synthase CmoA [Pseudomonadota bacterium]
MPNRKPNRKPNSKPTSKQRDAIYSEEQGQLVDFAFDERVVNVFPDMIRRSVPAYETVLPLSALFAGRYVTPPATVYDLGCSRGATTLALQRYCPAGTRIIGVDNSLPMIDSARDAIEDEHIEFRRDDLRTTPLEDAAAVVMTYTLQFVPPAERLALLTRIREALRPTGVFVYAEKIVLEDPSEQALLNDVHLDFKRANGYSELEISQKRSALEAVMIPESITAHRERLAQAGFARSIVWYRCLNWAAFAAFP